MRITIIVLVVASLGFLAWTLPQERMKKKGPPNFNKAAHEAIAAFDAGKFGTCARLMKKAGIALTMARRKVIRDGFPQIADCKVKDNMQFENAQGNTGMGGLFGVNLGGIVERTYDWGGGKTLKITVTLNEGMAKAVNNMMNMMGLSGQKGAELIKYHNEAKAILKVNGANTDWTMALGEGHVSARGRKVGDEEMLKHLNQNAVDRLGGAINN